MTYRKKFECRGGYIGERNNSRNHSQRSLDRTGQVYELHEQDYTTTGLKTI